MRAIGLVAFGLVLGLFVEHAFAGIDAMPDLSGYATKTQLPPAGSAMPPATALDGTSGTSAAYARSDHTHAARVQRTSVVTAQDGTATWTFARPFVVPAGQVPPISNMVEDTGSPVVVQIVSRTFTTDGTSDTHTAVTIKAQRSRTLPASLVVLGDLLKYDVFGIAGASVRVNLFAADPTQ
jgi:hypothetical protein